MSRFGPSNPRPRSWSIRSRAGSRPPGCGRVRRQFGDDALPVMILLQIIITGLLLGAIYALFSSGLTLIWGMMNVINFAHGEFVMIGMYVAFLIVTFLHGGPLAFSPAAAIVLFLLGIAVYFGLIRAIMRGPMIAQILSTFGLALLLRYLAFWLFSANFKTLPEDLIPGVLNLGGILIGMPQLVAGIAALALAFGGFGSVPGALAAGLIIGVIQSLSAYWFGPVYKDVIVYALFVAILWVRPQGLMGKV